MTIEKDYIQKNGETFNQQFIGGWGSKAPDSNLISIYYNNIHAAIFTSPVQRQEPPKLLDFGCGTGVNAKFFQDAGYSVYGIDISPKAVEIAVERHGLPTENFVCYDVINGEKSIKELFGVVFDVIISNQCVLCFSDSHIKKLAELFNGCMKPNGRLCASMPTNRYPDFYEASKEPAVDGLYSVAKSGNLNDVTYLNLIKTREDIVEKFSVFEKCAVLSATVESVENCFYESYFFIGKPTVNENE